MKGKKRKRKRAGKDRRAGKGRMDLANSSLRKIRKDSLLGSRKDKSSTGKILLPLEIP